VRALHVRGHHLDAPAEQTGRERDWRNGQQRQRRELRRRIEEQRRAQQAEHRGPQRIGELFAEHVLERRHVGPQPRGDLTGIAAVEELDVLKQQRLEDQAPQAEADAFGPEAEAVIAPTCGQGLDEHDADHHERQLIQALKLPPLNRFIDDQADDVRIRERRDDARRDEQAADQVRPPLRPQEAGDASELRDHAVNPI
jgi:hypothetical protein